MDRRAFFRQALRKSGEQVVRRVDAKVSRRAAHWIRPPYALEELEFLLACTRCGDCESACPHRVIFSLPLRLGTQVAGTPALDLLHRGCHLCDDWPCVAACEAAALVLPDAGGEAALPLPRLAVARIDPAACLPYSGPECGACADSCPVPGALVWQQTRPHIEAAACTGCARCREACIVEPRAIQVQSRYRQTEAEQPA